MKGFALIEVLVALLVLSFGLIGIAGMQLSALQHSQNSYLQSFATTQIFSILERLRVNASSVARENELIQWNEINAQLLPHGVGSYHCVGNLCTANVQWNTKQAYSISIAAYL